MAKRAQQNQQSKNLGVRRSPRIIKKNTNIRRTVESDRSAHDGAPVRFHSLSKIFIKYLLKLGIIYWHGEPMTLNNCSILMDFYLAGKITTKKFLIYFFQKNAPIQNFKFSKNDDGTYDKKLNKKLKDVIQYFSKKQNKDELQQARKVMRRIFYYLRRLLPFISWFNVFGNQYYFDNSYLRDKNPLFRWLHGVNFSSYIIGKDFINLDDLCQPILGQIKINQLKQLEQITNQQKRMFKKSKKQQKHLEHKSDLNGLEEFLILQTKPSKKLSIQKQFLLMDNFCSFNEQLVSSHSNPSLNLSKRHVPRKNAPLVIPNVQPQSLFNDLVQGQINPQQQSNSHPRSDIDNEQEEQRQIHVDQQQNQSDNRSSFGIRSSYSQPNSIHSQVNMFGQPLLKPSNLSQNFSVDQPQKQQANLPQHNNQQSIIRMNQQSQYQSDDFLNQDFLIDYTLKDQDNDQKITYPLRQ